MKLNVVVISNLVIKIETAEERDINNDGSVMFQVHINSLN